MENKKSFWIISFLALVPPIIIGIGALWKPSEFSMASWCLWTLAAAENYWTIRKHRYYESFFPFLYFYAYVFLVILMAYHGGYAWNVGALEMAGLTISVFGLLAFAHFRHGTPWALAAYFVSDSIACYPQLRQFLSSREPASAMSIVAWSLALAIALCYLIMVEGFHNKVVKELRNDEFRGAIRVIANYVPALQHFLFVSLFLGLMVASRT